MIAIVPFHFLVQGNKMPKTSTVSSSSTSEREGVKIVPTLASTLNHLSSLLRVARDIEASVINTAGEVTGIWTPVGVGSENSDPEPCGIIPILASRLDELDKTFARTIEELERLRNVLGILSPEKQQAGVVSGGSLRR